MYCILCITYDGVELFNVLTVTPIQSAVFLESPDAAALSFARISVTMYTYALAALSLGKPS